MILGNDFSYFCVSNDKRLLATFVPQTKTVCIYDLDTETLVNSIKVRQQCNSISLCSAKNTVACVKWYNDASKIVSKISVYNISNGKIENSHTETNHKICSAKISNLGRQIVYIYLFIHKTVLWNLDNNSKKILESFTEYPSCVCFSNDDSLIATSSATQINVWDRNGELKKHLANSSIRDGRLHHKEFRFTADSNSIAYVTVDRVVLWNFINDSFTSFNPDISYSHVEDYFCVFDVDTSRVNNFIGFTVGYEDAFYVYDVASKQLLKKIVNLDIDLQSRIFFSSNGRNAVCVSKRIVSKYDLIDLKDLLKISPFLIRHYVAPYVILDIINFIFANHSGCGFEPANNFHHYYKISCVNELINFYKCLQNNANKKRKNE